MGRSSVFLTAVCFIFLCMCGTSGTSNVSETEIPRDTDPQVSRTELSQLVQGCNSFAIELYGSIAADDGNFIFSPYSVSSAMAMTYAGARGETEEEMARVMGFTLPEDRLHTSLNFLSLDFSHHSSAESTFTLHIASALWGQEGHEFLPEFLNLLAVNYGAGMRMLDFSSAPQQCRQEINQWVAEQTEERIVDLIPPDALTTATKLVLTNAIYFNAQWMFPFDTYTTTELPFTLLTGEHVRVPTMTISEHFPVMYDDGYQAVELPYRGGRMSMLLILPDQGCFHQIEEALTGGFIEDAVSRLRDASIYLGIPKFQVESQFRLEDILSQMGMPSAFGLTADFSGMDGERSLFISSIVHQAFVSVDEYGTEASAATAVIMEKMNGESSMDFFVDRPFIYIVRDRETSAILFIGRVLNPME